MEQSQHRGEEPTRPTVLLIDDDRIILNAFSLLLADKFIVVTADSAKSALKILVKQQNFAAVLCDVMMPIMSGAQLYQQVCDLYPTLKTKFAFVTGGAHTDETMAFLKKQNNILEKPIEQVELEQMIQRIIRNNLKGE